jgi:minor extracellular serine protease Vpr
MQILKGSVVRATTLRKWMRHFQVLTGAALIAALVAAPIDAFSQQANASRFKALPRSGPINGKMPLSLRSKERVRVVVTMSTASVAEVRATTADHTVSQSDHDAIQTQIMNQHASLEPSIVSRGGRVLAHYHDALNGMKIEIARGEIADLANLPGVVQVVDVPKYKMKNVVSVPYIGAPEVWQGIPGYRGEKVKLAIIDTGVDYTHANFGGPGTVAAFTQAAATSTQPADPTMFGPKAPKVKGGTDLVGDDYDADDPTSVPVPDPNPLDCNGHGSHVSGTAAGFGVTADGKTYQGPYDEAAYSVGFGIGPGVAPKADLYMIRVFGCTGSTDVVTDAIEWAVHNNMDVISMSLGGVYGSRLSSDAIASDNAAKAGIIVVAAAGNAGPAPYVDGDPSTGTRAISVAANNARAFLVNGLKIAFASGATVNGVEAIAMPLPKGNVPAVILKAAGILSLGCNASDYPAGGVAGALVILSRGTCSFDQKTANATAAGAAAIGVVNNAAGFFAPLLTNPKIPFIELQLSDTPIFLAQPQPTTATVTTANVPDTTFQLAAAFSSGGPRTDDGALKPNITAPGVNVFSTDIGTGTGGTYDSGTSMATPHVAGVAALTVQAHKNWHEPGLRAAIVETASPEKLPDYSPRIEGSGLVQPVGAVGTQVTAHADQDTKLGLLSFGIAELTKNFKEERDIIVRNHERFPATFTATATTAAGVPHAVQLSRSTVSVRGHEENILRMDLSVPAGSAGATHDDAGNMLFNDASGVISLKPEAGANNGVALSLPYYLVTHARSTVDATLREGKSPSVRLTNKRGVIAGNGDFYAWGLSNKETKDISPGFDPRAVGVQSNQISATDSILVFAINTHGRFSNAAQGEFDIYIDVNGDGVYDYVLFSGDTGIVEGLGEATGQLATFLVNLKTGDEIEEFLGDAPYDGSTIEMPVLASDLGISPTNPRFTYTLNAFDNIGGEVDLKGVKSASFNAFTPALSNALFVPVGPNLTVDVPVSINKAEFKKTPAMGFMVVTEDNVSGESQANLLKVTE